MAATEHHDESVRELDQIRHTNETISQQDDTYRAQTEASNIQIVTPHYKSGDKPGSEVRTGASAAELNARFAETNGDYKAERSQEHFRMQIIDPKVNTNAHIPAHAPREYARKKLIEDFPSLHGKRSFLDLDALEQRNIRKNKPIPMSEYLTKSIDRHPKKDDFRDLDKLRQSLDALQKRTKTAFAMTKLLKVHVSWRQNANEVIQQKPWRSVDSLAARRISAQEVNIDIPLPHESNVNLTKLETTFSTHLNPMNNREQIISTHTKSVDDRFLPLNSVASCRRCATTTPHELVRKRTEKYLRNFIPRANDAKRDGVKAKLPRARSEGEIFASPLDAISGNEKCERNYSSTTVTTITEKHTIEEKVVVSNGRKENKNESRRLGGHEKTTAYEMENRCRKVEFPPETGPSQSRNPPTDLSQPSTSASNRLPSHRSHIDDPEFQRQIQENLCKHRHQTSVGSNYFQKNDGRLTAVPFGGPFFELVEVNSQAATRPPKNYPIPPKAVHSTTTYTSTTQSPHSASLRSNALRQQANAISNYTRPITPTCSITKNLKQDERNQPSPWEDIRNYNESIYSKQCHETVAPIIVRPVTSNNNRLPEKNSNNTNINVPSAYSMDFMEIKQSSSQDASPVDNNQTNDDAIVVIWPPLSEKERQNAAKELAAEDTPRSIYDAERAEEYLDQKAREMEAMRVREESAAILREKQEKAHQLQQLNLREKQQQQSPLGNNKNIIRTVSNENLPIIQTQLANREAIGTNSNHVSPNLKIFETRPIRGNHTEALARNNDGSAISWRQAYTVSADLEASPSARNEIVTSSEVLQREFDFDIDLLKRREAFIEKISEAPKIRRLGRRWQPPPDSPPPARVLPTSAPCSTSASSDAQIHLDVTDYLTQSNPNLRNKSEDCEGYEIGEYRWTPVVHDPKFKRERKNFTPLSSPLIRVKCPGGGKLDEAAERQLRDVIHPAADGSHRPPIEFESKRHKPAGGFFPHAPNVGKVIVKRRMRRHANDVDEAASLSSNCNEIEEYLKDMKLANSNLTKTSKTTSLSVLIPETEHNTVYSRDEIARSNDWSTSSVDDLPAHSSTITIRGYGGGGAKRAVDVRQKAHQFESRAKLQPTHSSALKAYGKKHFVVSNAPPIPPHRPKRDTMRSASAQRTLKRIEQATQASPAPPSYATARPYIPPALPPGYRRNKAASQPKDLSASPAAIKMQTNEELDELARLGREIEQRSKSRRAEYKVEKVEPETKNSSLLSSPLSASWRHLSSGPAALSPRSYVSFNDALQKSTSTHRDYFDAESRYSSGGGLLKQVRDTNGYGASSSAINECQGRQQKQRYSYASTMKSLLREVWEQKTAAERSERYSESYRNSTVIQLEEPAPAPPVIRTVVRQEPIRREVVEVRREVKPKVTQNVQRFEEKKRTEEVERRVIRRERRHKSSRIRYGHGSSGHHQEFHDWNNRGLRSSSAASRNGFGGGGGGDYYYHSSSRHGGGGAGADSASDRFFQQNRVSENARYGSLSDSLRRGDLKYGPNGDVRENGHHHQQNGHNGNEKYSSAKRVHKSYSTRDVFHDGSHGGSGYGYSHQPLVEFPPTLPRHGANYHQETHQNGYNAPAPPPHRSHNGFTSDYYGGGSSGYGSGRLTKSRSYADWDGSRSGPFGSGVRRYDDDMARLENEFRDSLLMKLPTNGGNMNEKDYRHQEIPGGYETYEREVKASSGRKVNPEGLPTDFKDSTQGYNYKRETQR